MNTNLIDLPRRLLLALTGCLLVLSQACATSGARVPDAEAGSRENGALLACTAEIRAADCPWQISYPHVRAQHCEVSCRDDRESAYFARFIDSCTNFRLEQVCYLTVYNPGCQYYVDDRGRFVVTADLGIPVGEDTNDGCRSSTLSTVVLDRYYRVVTMYPGN